MRQCDRVICGASAYAQHRNCHFEKFPNSWQGTSSDRIQPHRIDLGYDFRPSCPPSNNIAIWQYFSLAHTKGKLWGSFFLLQTAHTFSHSEQISIAMTPNVPESSLGAYSSSKATTRTFIKHTQQTVAQVSFILSRPGSFEPTLSSHYSVPIPGPAVCLTTNTSSWSTGYCTGYTSHLGTAILALLPVRE